MGDSGYPSCTAISNRTRELEDLNDPKNIPVNVSGIARKVTNMSEAILSLNKIQQVLVVTAVSSTPKTTSNFSFGESPLISPSAYLWLLNQLHQTEDTIRNRWEQISQKERQRLLSFTESFIDKPATSAKTRKEIEEVDPKVVLEAFITLASVKWASLVLRRDVFKDLGTALESCIDALIERLIVEQDFNQVDSEEKITISLNDGTSSQVYWKDVDDFLDTNRNRIQYQAVPNQSPRRAKSLSSE